MPDYQDPGRGGPLRFGEVIRHRRLSLGWTQEDLAQRTGMLLKGSGISKIERGREERIGRVRLEALAHALGFPIGYLWKASSYPGASLRDVDTEAELAEVPLAFDPTIRDLARWLKQEQPELAAAKNSAELLRLAADWLERERQADPA